MPFTRDLYKINNLTIIMEKTHYHFDIYLALYKSVIFKFMEDMGATEKFLGFEIIQTEKANICICGIILYISS